ncbi:LLM class flavin-dependent oxidoreductase [Enterobacteriaceae bacterium YMB-R22]|uniref:LLM class flavin-dependent oxidoreductase n=1 Tax=Tenebrionicola larvae TaxID=2815733 RepID=UPI0020113724|nr:LLM class flavin-dependent oxidoreductase [Tenebrionicola larvae]MBV4411939.1 LLM class flavin-dependent oxidoreductase [Tenebrionicola larvae]
MNTEKECQFGVFLPVASGGWIISENTPPLDASWQQNRDAAVLADELGLDFIMSMGKWRGFGGKTDHWGRSLESVTLMAGIAACTKRARLIATMHAGLHNPAVAAKMIATLDAISGGRAGLNVVSGSYRDEFSQMGAWDASLNHDARYEMTQEWTQAVTRLWMQERVTLNGEFFTLEDCVSEPKPVTQPRPWLICAGQSERGLRFTVQHTDACFIGGKDLNAIRNNSQMARRLAREYDTTTRVYCMCSLIIAATDKQAQETEQYYREGIDTAGVEGIMKSYGMDIKSAASLVARASSAFMNHTIVGSPQTCARLLVELIRSCELDGVMLTFPEYRDGLEVFGRQIMPQVKAALR